MIYTKDWKDYQLIDTGNKEKLERWGDILLRRPDPQAIWPMDEDCKEWKRVHAHYHRSDKGGGSWEYKKTLPEFWNISYKELTFKIQPTGFKHTGLFPEQAINWDFMMNKIRNEDREIRVLNLFAYTGGATMACAAAGASEVVHVDASKGMVNWAKENMELSHLTDRKIRFIVDDVMKFVEREKRRGRTYHGIVMDPPSYGRGPNGEVWKIEEQILPLIQACLEIWDEEPLFFLINSYTTGFSPVVLENVMRRTICERTPGGQLQCGEIGLPQSRDGMVLPCGIYGRWEK
ncbi:MAG: SAM-dependent methyltransferase [Erysipelotrichaceae bacterium]|nr:SAM-dependent methyltransferase [Erysipelotrichaceae bacterium]MBR3693649.1 class I SAM-dependent methyltransferase [Erysipelotrichales bacterium]